MKDENDVDVNDADPKEQRRMRRYVRWERCCRADLLDLIVRCRRGDSQALEGGGSRRESGGWVGWVWLRGGAPEGEGADVHATVT
jgi:hypothetical protein